MFHLQRVFAYSVVPQRTLDMDSPNPPNGGIVQITEAIDTVVENAFGKISKNRMTTVDFVFDAGRKNPVRDDVLIAAFGATQAPKSAVLRLATRLAETMDLRSRSALFLVTVEAEEDKRRVSLLVLPREDVIQLGGVGDDLLLELLKNAFSTGSGLRKVARLTGHQGKTQFISAEVLDLLLGSQQKSVADFWIERFLNAKPRMDSSTGSRELAYALQRAFDASAETDRDASMAAILHASSGMTTRTSLDAFSKQLPAQLRSAYFRGIETEPMRNVVFDVNRSVIKESLSRLVMTTKDGVVISAPASTVGKTVKVTRGAKRTAVSYSGTVEKERIARGRSEAEQ